MAIEILNIVIMTVPGNIHLNWDISMPTSTQDRTMFQIRYVNVIIEITKAMRSFSFHTVFKTPLYEFEVVILLSPHKSYVILNISSRDSTCKYISLFSN